MLTCFIMAGGTGQRFWPLSRINKPKQLLSLFTEKTMIRETVDRILPLVPPERIFIGTNVTHAKAIKEELSFIPEENIIIEPLFKDTAAAIAYGTIIIEEKFPEGQMIVLASDHLIKNEKNFRKRVNTAVNEAINSESIITLGVKPTRAETGYGYIEAEEAYIGEATKAIRFWEKPNLERAEDYVASGKFLWNSGMFIWKISTIMNSFKKYMPKHYKLIEEIKEIRQIEKNYDNRVKEIFEKFDKISIDFGIMERSENIKVIPVDFGWNDIGSFTALDEVLNHDEHGEVIKNAMVVEHQSKNNIIIGVDNKKLIAVIGIEDSIIVETEDALLVAKKSHSSQIKKIMKELEQKYL